LVLDGFNCIQQVYLSTTVIYTLCDYLRLLPFHEFFKCLRNCFRSEFSGNVYTSYFSIQKLVL